MTPPVERSTRDLLIEVRAKQDGMAELLKVHVTQLNHEQTLQRNRLDAHEEQIGTLRARDTVSTRQMWASIISGSTAVVAVCGLVISLL